MVNFRVVAFILGVLLILEGAFMLLAAPVSLYYGVFHSFRRLFALGYLQKLQ